MQQLASLRATMKQLHVKRSNLQICISLIISSIFIWFLQPVHAQLDPSQQTRDTLFLDEFACRASDPASLKKCIEEVKATRMPLVKITAPIICTNPLECNFELKNIKTDTTFFAAKTEFKIIRKGDFSYPLFTVENSSGIRFYEIGLEDQGTGACPPATLCPTVLQIKSSNNISIERSDFNKIRGNAVSVSESRNINIIDSTFTNGFKTGLEVTSTLPTESINIENNTFSDNAGSALLFQGVSFSDRQSSISSNIFNNNHSKGAYANCVYPCTGSQVKISGPAANLRFTQNKVTGGGDTGFDTLGLYSSGVEVGNNSLANITFFCNEISGNRGSGIVQSSPFRDIIAISISENKVWGNGLNLNIPTANVAEDNCYTEECQLACATGK